MFIFHKSGRTVDYYSFVCCFMLIHCQSVLLGYFSIYLFESLRCPKVDPRIRTMTTDCNLRKDPCSRQYHLTSSPFYNLVFLSQECIRNDESQLEGILSFSFGIPYFCYKHGCVLRSWLRRHPGTQRKTLELCTRSLRKECRMSIQKGSVMFHSVPDRTRVEMYTQVS